MSHPFLSRSLPLHSGDPGAPKAWLAVLGCFVLLESSLVLLWNLIEIKAAFLGGAGWKALQVATSILLPVTLLLSFPLLG